ncbi:hypothetical protein [Streptomyces halobius]|uniref:Berberine/berberine-like domain-containing protein n=1 Tax=Streptomyces halobius TaxID=2879846 RepID=A0ABY4M7B3_9ACTN|nr:hypothetical protein [Streptomyces halobius]UQA93578.1 hypothetical protein K9S39_18505 [Streptomyces halobius]
MAALTGPESLRPQAAPTAPVMVVLQLNHMGGAMAAGDGAAGAVGHRDARFLLRLLSPLGAGGPQADPATDLAAVRALHDEALAAVAPWRLGRNVNFVFGAHGERAAAAARRRTEVARSLHGDGAHRRLAALKAAHDPENMFRFHPYDAGTSHPNDVGTCHPYDAGTRHAYDVGTRLPSEAGAGTRHP